MEIMVLRGYCPHIVPRGEEKKALKQSEGKRARRWVVERTFSWLNRFRKLLVRYEKKDANYLGLCMFACAFICYRQVDII